MKKKNDKEEDKRESQWPPSPNHAPASSAHTRAVGPFKKDALHGAKKPPKPKHQKNKKQKKLAHNASFFGTR